MQNSIEIGTLLSVFLVRLNSDCCVPITTRLIFKQSIMSMVPNYSCSYFVKKSNSIVHLEIPPCNWSGASMLCIYGSKSLSRTGFSPIRFGTKFCNLCNSYQSFSPAYCPTSWMESVVFYCIRRKVKSSFFNGAEQFAKVWFIDFVKELERCLICCVNAYLDTSSFCMYLKQ